MDSSANAESHGAATCVHSVAFAASRSKFAGCVIDYLSRNPTSARHRQSELADRKRCRLRHLSARPVAMIRIDAIWLATEPMDMRAGTDTALARVVAVFGAPPASGQVLLAGFSTRLSDGIRCRTTACPGAGVALAKSWARQRNFHHITPATTSQAVQLSDEPIVAFRLFWQNRRHDFAS